VLPLVWYGMICFLIRDDVGSVPCSDEWEVALSFAQAHMVQEGLWYRDYPGNHSITMVPRTTLAKPAIRPIVNLCNGM
jgi:hypothetical protein